MIKKFIRHSRAYDYKSVILFVSIFILILSYFTFELQCERHFNLDGVASSYSTGIFNRSEPIIFVGGVPRSGTTLMRCMLDAHPLIRCGEETRLIPRILFFANSPNAQQMHSQDADQGGVNRDTLDSAVSSFMLEIIVRHGKPAQNLCNKDPFVLKFSEYVTRLFPNSKFILMIRDARATVHSIISRKVGISGFKPGDYNGSFAQWNKLIEQMYSQCMVVGPSRCHPVYYEQLVLRPEKEMRKLFKFLNIPWSDAVLNHEQFIGDEISLSKVEKSTDQVIKPVNLEALTTWVDKIPSNILDSLDTIAPMLKKLGYDTKSRSPNYGEADQKVRDNTLQIQENREYWINIAKKYSVHANNTDLQPPR
jgi:protein-tyrosine sulfotransferase